MHARRSSPARPLTRRRIPAGCRFRPRCPLVQSGAGGEAGNPVSVRAGRSPAPARRRPPPSCVPRHQTALLQVAGDDLVPAAYREGLAVLGDVEVDLDLVLVNRAPDREAGFGDDGHFGPG